VANYLDFSGEGSLGFGDTAHNLKGSCSERSGLGHTTAAPLGKRPRESQLFIRLRIGTAIALGAVLLLGVAFPNRGAPVDWQNAVDGWQ
jgi:hypothetical protein